MYVRVEGHAMLLVRVALLEIEQLRDVETGDAERPPHDRPARLAVTAAGDRAASEKRFRF